MTESPEQTRQPVVLTFDRVHLGMGDQGTSISASQCSRCGALVGDLTQHAAWHVKMEPGVTFAAPPPSHGLWGGQNLGEQFVRGRFRD